MRYSRNTSPLDLEFVGGKGAVVWTRNGDRYIDASAQTFNLIFGHRCEIIDDCVKAQIDEVSYLSSRFSFVAHADALKEMEQVSEGRFPFVSFKVSSGSLAVEHTLKAARKASARQIVIALSGGYHGQSFECARISGSKGYQGYLEPRNAVFTPTPNCADCPVGCDLDTCSVECLDQLSRLLEHELECRVAAFILEPILVEAGMIVVPEKYMRRARSICNQFGMALIFDEVQTAGGWLDSYFSFLTLERKDSPDMVALGKAISSGYPLSAALIGEKYDILEYGEHEITYGGTPIGLAAFVAAARLSRSLDFSLAKVRIAKLLEERIRHLRSLEGIFHVRGSGLMWSVGVRRADLGRVELQALLLRAGVAARTTLSEDKVPSVQLKISVFMTDSEIDRVFDAIEEVVM